MDMPFRAGLFAGILMFVAVAAPPVQAQEGDVPAIVSYQGQLLVNGQPVDGSQQVSFAFLDDSGAEIWEQDYTVEVSDGVFDVQLGREGGSSLAEAFEEHDVMFLSVTADGDEIDRIRLAAAPYALRAATADAIRDGAAVQEINGVRGSVTFSTSEPMELSQQDDNLVLTLADEAITADKLAEGSVTADKIDEEAAVQSLSVQGDDEAITGEVRLRGSGNIDVSRSGQDIVFRTRITSSERYKEDIRPITDALGVVEALEGKSFSWKDSGEEDLGLIAEEVEKVLPQVVYHSDSEGVVEGINYYSLVALLVEAINEQQSTIGALEERIERLERTVEQ